MLKGGNLGAVVGHYQGLFYSTALNSAAVDDNHAEVCMSSSEATHPSTSLSPGAPEARKPLGLKTQS